MRHAERGRSVLAYTGCKHLAFLNDRIDVIDISRDKSFKNELRRVITPVVAIVQIVQHLPNQFFRLAFSNTECRYLVPRFYDPRGRYVFEKIADHLLVEHTRELRT